MVYVDRRRTAKVPLSLLRHPRLQMTRAGLAVLGLAAGSQPKTLLGSLVSLLLGHDSINLL